MTGPALISVVTTIQPPTAAMRGLRRALRRAPGRIIVVGDRKGPKGYPLDGSDLLSLQDQIRLPLRLPKRLPLNHYARKNIGYLVAISRHPQCLHETDDDNLPLAHWGPRERVLRVRMFERPPWCNVFRHFSRAHIWPRGLPLEEIARSPGAPGPACQVSSPIQQGLADGSPDVDAIWRLVLDAPVTFRRRPSVALKAGVWCPFNSQSTWWWPEAFPLLYLPSHCTFRMTDIWRSFVAQRCVWELGGCVAFHAAEVVQHRNPHSLLRDFRDEVPGYLSNDAIRITLERLRLESGPASAPENLRRCYEALIRTGVFPRKEMALVNAWLADVDRAERGPEL